MRPPELKGYQPYVDPKSSIKPLTTPSKLREYLAAQHFGMLPWIFDNLNPDRKGLLMALYAVQNEMESYENSEKNKLFNRQIEEADRKTGKRG